MNGDVGGVQRIGIAFMSPPGIIRPGFLHIRSVAVDVSKSLWGVEENRVGSHTNLIPCPAVSPFTFR